jgi:thiol-disulfide isomerase/thioredoxin
MFLTLGAASAQAVTATAAPAKSCNDAGKMFDSCADQGDLYIAAAAKAIQSKKLVMVIMGANWCPVCARMNTMLETKEVAEQLDSSVVIVKIAATQNTSAEYIESFGEVFWPIYNVNHWTAEADFRGFPTTVILDPYTLSGVYFEGLEVTADGTATDVPVFLKHLEDAKKEIHRRIDAGEIKGVLPYPSK